MSLGIRSAIALLGAVGLVGLTVAPTVAVSPNVVRESLHRERPFIQCPSGDWMIGSWDVQRTITTYVDASGAAISDHFVVQFTGTISNPATGASEPDSGRSDFHDRLASDGSFLSTIFTYERTSAYLHEAGQQVLGPSDSSGNQDTLRTVGMSHFDSGIPALCAALGD